MAFDTPLRDRLRIAATWSSRPTAELLHTAASHIERLEAQVVELRATVQFMETQWRETQ
jgi:hypothetical protein